MTAMGVAELLLAGEVEGAELDAAVDAAGASDVAAVLLLADHADVNVRRAVALVLPLLTHGDPPTEPMIEVAIRLTRDADLRVRDHATLALGQQWREIDTPELREALAARLDDIDRGTRSEALVGLAYRRDARVLPRVREALARPSGDVWRLEIVAAGALGDPRLHELVRRHRHGWTEERDARDADAASRLTDPAGPGVDVLEGVARLYRRRAHGLPDGDALAAWQVMDAMLDIAPHRAPQLLSAVLERLAHDQAAQREVRERSALARLAAEIDQPSG